MKEKKTEQKNAMRNASDGKEHKIPKMWFYYFALSETDETARS